MDPDKAWADLAECFTSTEEADWDRIGELADNLLHWLKRDGFPPKITGNRAFDKLVAMRALEAICDWQVSTT